MSETGPSSPALIVDANIALWAVIPILRDEDAQAIELFAEWGEQTIRLMAPSWWLAECITGIRRVLSVGKITDAEAHQAIDKLFELGVEMVPIDRDLCESALDWAGRIKQARAYDAFYLALAEREGVELWTADKRLVTAARLAGFSSIHLIGAS